jgi:ketosteroid isomerase-like protein
VDIVRRGLEALQRGDDAPLFEAAAPDFEGRALSGGIAEDVFRGREEARRWQDAFLSAWEAPELEILEIVDAGDNVAGRLRWRLRGRVSRFETEREVFWIYTLVEGKIVRAREYVSWKKALEAVGLREAVHSRGGSSLGAREQPSPPPEARQTPS